ncbi:Hypothetical protein (Fragment) [Durusdinium trenchii]|uniref:Uncharacterized protein n=1 Tax=Durusdinium trenchii TaxID=1381693 RepID=A0ABP0HY43_9DINO
MRMLAVCLVTAILEKPRMEHALQVLPISMLNGLSLLTNSSASFYGSIAFMWMIAVNVPIVTLGLEQIKGKMMALSYEGLAGWRSLSSISAEAQLGLLGSIFCGVSFLEGSLWHLAALQAASNPASARMLPLHETKSSRETKLHHEFAIMPWERYPFIERLAAAIPALDEEHSAFPCVAKWPRRLVLDDGRGKSTPAAVKIGSSSKSAEQLVWLMRFDDISKDLAASEMVTYLDGPLASMRFPFPRADGFSGRAERARAWRVQKRATVTGLQSNSPYDVQIFELCSSSSDDSSAGEPEEVLWTLPGYWDIHVPPHDSSIYVVEDTMEAHAGCEIIKSCCGDQFSLCFSGNESRTVEIQRVDTELGWEKQVGWGQDLYLRCHAPSVAPFKSDPLPQAQAEEPHYLRLHTSTHVTAQVVFHHGTFIGGCQCASHRLQTRPEGSSTWRTEGGDCLVPDLRGCSVQDLVPNARIYSRLQTTCLDESMNSNWSQTVDVITRPGCTWTFDSSIQGADVNQLECVDKTFCDIADEPLGQFQRSTTAATAARRDEDLLPKSWGAFVLAREDKGACHNEG